MNPLRILYDGWPLCREPNSPAALHLLALLAYLPEHIQPLLLCPETPPPWVPNGLQIQVEPTPLAARLPWEQRILPQWREKLEAQLLHLTTETVSLLNGTQTVISPTQPGEMDARPDGASRGGMFARLRGALAAGGTVRAQALIWPEDLPPRPGRDVILLPPIVHPDFTPDAWPDPLQIPGVDLPETYVLYHGPEDDLRRALEAWTWVAGPIGQDYPLVLLGLGAEALATVEAVAQELNIRDTVVPLPGIPPGWVGPLYRRAEVVFHPGRVSTWGGAIRHALACGKPVVAAESAWASEMVGPAAILVHSQDTRRLGASVIGIIVKENLSARLREAALAQSAGWTDARWGEKLGAAYARVLEQFP